MRTIGRTHAFEPRSADFGLVPKELNGRLYRLGPGKFELDNQTFQHWFDGEGLVTAVDFANGSVSVANSLIEPAGQTKRAYALRGRFGKAPTRAWRNWLSLFRADMYINPANTALMLWGDRLFALYEGDLPTEIDPETLAARGETKFGVVRRGFSAHPKYHRPTGAIINQGFRTPWRPHLDYYALGANGAARQIGSTPFSGGVLTHDFAVTDRYIISICSPLRADVGAIALQSRSISDALKWDPARGTEILVTPIDMSTPTQRIVTDPFLYSHTANAYDDGEEIVVHGALAPDASGVDWIGSIRRDAEALKRATPGRLTELRINPAKGTVSANTLAPAAADYPRIDPSRAGTPHSIIYAAGFRDEERAYSDLFDVIVKVDLARNATAKFDFGDGHFVSEAVFAPRLDSGAEDDGWLLCLNYNANADESYVAILSATGELDLVATIPVGQALPMSFHGLWVARTR